MCMRTKGGDLLVPRLFSCLLFWGLWAAFRASGVSLPCRGLSRPTQPLLFACGLACGGGRFPARPGGLWAVPYILSISCIVQCNATSANSAAIPQSAESLRCYSSGTYSATSSNRQFKIVHSLFSVCVDTGISAWSRWTVAWLMPCLNRSV